MAGSEEQFNQLAKAIQKITNTDEPLTQDTHLRDDLNMDSGALIELTVLIHTEFGVDVGRVSAERKVIPQTIEDLLGLLND